MEGDCEQLAEVSLDSNSQRCNATTTVNFIMDLFLGACGDGLVVYVICSSWNWRRDVTYFLCSAVIIGFGASVIFVGQSIFHLLDNKDIAVINLEVVQTCNISNVPSSFIKLFIVYVSQLCMVVRLIF